MVQQCVGPSLDVEAGTGILDVRLAGEPAEAALPSTGNSLRLDPARGVWAPADHKALQIAASRSDSFGGAIIHPGSTKKSGVLSTTITNPSAERQMLCLINFHAKESHNIAARVDSGVDVNAGYSGWGFLFGFDVDADPASAVTLNTDIVRRDHGVLGAEKGYTHSLSDSGHVLLAPAESAVVRFQIGLVSYDWGYVRYNASWHEIRGIGVTL